MKRFWEHYKLVILSLGAWRLMLAIIELASPYVFPLRHGFLESVRWANMDGGHYLYIARAGYGLYEQAFFPLYPMLISLVSFVPVLPPYIGLLISHAAFFTGVLLFYDLALEVNKKQALWSVIFLLVFPTSFYFAAVYSTSLFFLLSVATFWAIRKRHWLIAGIVGALASATRIFGVVLIIPSILEYVKVRGKRRLKDIASICLIPTGLIAYMVYLYVSAGDALSFMHVLPAYGSERSGGHIILLPQVLWRYAKILFTAQPNTVEYGIAVLEIAVFTLFAYLLVRATAIRLPASYIVYAAAILIIPTLTGTLTSIPRYVLDAFPLFIVLGMGHNKMLKATLAAVLFVGLVFCTSLFLQGYFIA